MTGGGNRFNEFEYTAGMFDLTGQAALVTGASGGIGGAIARALHRHGATVALAGTRTAALEALAQQLGERAHVITADLADPDAVERLARDAEAAMGKLDILVNNAGITRDNLALRMKDEDWQAVLDVNLTAAFRLTRAVLRGMVRRRHGRIISIASVVGITGNPGQANYAAAKAAMIGMTKSLAAEVATRPPRRCLARRRLSRQRRSRLRHRPDAPRQWRHGDALTPPLVGALGRRRASQLCDWIVRMHVGMNRAAASNKQSGRIPRRRRPDRPSWGFLGAPGRVHHPATANPYAANLCRGSIVLSRRIGRGRVVGNDDGSEAAGEEGARPN